MSKENQWDPQFINELLQKKAGPNWSEQTGPFFHLQIPNEPAMGPFQGAELKNIFEGANFPQGTSVRDAKSIADWQDIYEHPFFQRRRPQLLSTEDFPKEINQAFVLIEGVKHGPYSLNEIDALFEEKELLLTDQVSFDEGASWRKLYEYEEYDRRNHQQSALPESPGWDVFKESNSEITDELQKVNEQKQEEEAIAGLAFLENLKSGKTAKSYDKTYPTAQEDDQTLAKENDIEEPAKEASLPKAHDPKAPINKRKFQYAYAVGILCMLFGSFYFLTSKPSRPQRNLSSNQNQEAPMLEPSSPTEGKSAKNAKGNRNSYRSPRLKPKLNPRTRKPASITTSDSFRRDDRRMEENPYQEDDYYKDQQQEDDYYKEDYAYDRGDTPVEQDPIRSKLDKKTIDSQENFYDDGQQEQFQAEYDAPYEDAAQIEPAEVWGDAPQEGRLPAAEEGLYNEEALYEDKAY
jgi:hypothetical protein